MTSPPKNPELRTIINRFYGRVITAWVIAALALAIGCYLSIMSGDWRWFSRSGALAVVAGIWLVSWDLRNEVRSENLDFSEPYIVKEYEKRGTKNPTRDQLDEVKELLRETMISLVRPQFSRNELRIVALGTIVWGFGDLMGYVLGGT